MGDRPTFQGKIELDRDCLVCAVDDSVTRCCYVRAFDAGESPTYEWMRKSLRAMRKRGDLFGSATYKVGHVVSILDAACVAEVGVSITVFGADGTGLLFSAWLSGMSAAQFKEALGWAK